MRIFLSVLILFSMAFAGDKYSIQVISAKHKASITDEFIKKINLVSMPYANEYKDRQYKVIVGNFSSIKEARAVLPKIRSRIASDAFIRTDIKNTLLEHKINLQNIKSNEDKPEKIEAYKPNKRDLHKQEISDALAFYKNSSFYKFKN